MGELVVAGYVRVGERVMSPKSHLILCSNLIKFQAIDLKVSIFMYVLTLCT